MNVDRNKVRELVKEYRESVKQKEAILLDKDIQNYFKNGENYKVIGVVESRYPQGTQLYVDKVGISLVTEVVKSIPEYQNLNGKDIWKNKTLSTMLISIAEKM